MATLRHLLFAIVTEELKKNRKNLQLLKEERELVKLCGLLRCSWLELGETNRRYLHVMWV